MAIAVYNYGRQSNDFQATCTLSFDVGSDSGRALYVMAITDRPDASISSATYNGVAMTAAQAQWAGVDFGGLFPRRRLFYLGDPDTGTHDIRVTYSNGNTKPALVAISLSGVDTSTMLSGLTNAGTASSTPTWTISSATGNLVVALLMADRGAADLDVSSSGSTKHLESSLSGWGGTTYGIALSEAGASSVDIGGAYSGSTDWAGVAFSVPASGGGGGLSKTNRMMLGCG